jgi:hypothetical protein
MYPTRRPFDRLLPSLAFLLASPAAFSADTIIVTWNQTFLQSVRDSKLGTPMVARALAVGHTCIYDAWAAYDSKALGTQFGKALRRPAGERTDANKRQAISYAAYRAAVDLFPADTAKFDSLMNTLGYDPAHDNTHGNSPAAIGNKACAAVLAFRHNDGSNQLGNLNGGAPYSDYTGYVPVNTPDQINDPNHWQPLRVSDGAGGTLVQKFVAPHWGLVAPFALQSIEQYPVKTPPLFGSNEYLQNARELVAYSAGLTDTQKVIAQYWADGPKSELPPGHWDLFAAVVSARDAHGIDDDAKMFFAMTSAVHDAGVWAWGIKRKYDYVRPITAIHYLFAGEPITAWGGPYQGTQTIMGEDWMPFQTPNVVTPSFAEYVSGHSTFSAAASEVLKRYTRSDVFGHAVTLAAGSSPIEPGMTPAHDLTLSWATFTDAANEAGLSRRYGGIHFHDGDLEGRRVGRLIGEAAWREAQHLFNGN